MLKKASKRKIYDALHKTVVIACMGLSVGLCIDLGYIGFQYYFHIRPARKAEALRIQQELLQEGTPDNAQKLAT